MLFLQKKYVNILGSNMDRFHWDRENLACCRCPICGDSSKKKTKTRFYFIEADKGWRVFCHNCQYSNAFLYFLKQQNYPLYVAYIEDLLRFQSTSNSVSKEVERKDDPVARIEEPTGFSIDNLNEYCTNLADLLDVHPAKKYLRARQVPEDQLCRFWWTSKFKDLAVAFNPENYLLSKFDTERIVIPFLNKSGDQVFALQGRTIDPNSSMRYVTLKSKNHETWQKIFGLEKLDRSQTHYILEGPIDSVFLKNAVAMAGLKSTIDVNLDNENTVYVFDNQPRNLDVINSMSRTIKQGKKIVIFPTSITGKDINEMVLKDGMSPSEIQDLLETHTYRDLTAFMKFSQWTESYAR